MAALAFTTLAEVKARIDPKSEFLGTAFDTLLASLMTEADDTIEHAIGRELLEESRVVYLDGAGDTLLILPTGPLVSVTSVIYIEYGDDGADPPAIVETPTTLGTALYVLEGLRGEGYWGRGMIRRIDGTWLAGVRNYKVTYIGGIADGVTNVPKKLKALALNLISAAFFTRDAHGLISKEIGDSIVNPVSSANMDRAVDRAVARFRSGLR